MNTTRQKILLSLLAFDKPLDYLREKLSKYPWECNESTVIFKKKHIENVLRRFLQGEINAADLEYWANLIEGREDIRCEATGEEIIDEIIFELANPVLVSEASKISRLNVIKLMNSLKSAESVRSEDETNQSVKRHNYSDALYAA